MQKTLQDATKALTENDNALAAQPAPAGLARAALLMSRTQTLLIEFDTLPKTATLAAWRTRDAPTCKGAWVPRTKTSGAVSVDTSR